MLTGNAGHGPLHDYGEGAPTQSTIKTYFASLNMITNLSGGVTMSEHHYHDHGRCYTFGPPANASFEKPIPGHKNGYKIYFQYFPGNLTNEMLKGGMDIFVHDPYKHWTGEQCCCCCCCCCSSCKLVLNDHEHL